MKLCSDCKHWRPRIGIFRQKSPHPRCGSALDAQGRQEFAEIERMALPGYSRRRCGPDALFFEPKRGAP